MSNEKFPAEILNEAVYVTRYAGSGVINTTIGFIVIFVAMAVGFSPVISNVSGYAVGFTLGFILSKKFVFGSNGRYMAEALRYLVAFIISFLVNLIVLQLALAYFQIHAIISQLAAAGSYTLFMYIMMRVYVFGMSKNDDRNLENS